MNDPTREDILNRVLILEADIADLKNDAAEQKAALRSNTAITNQVKKDTSELLELFHTFTTAMKLGMKFTLTVGKVAQWIAGIVVAGGIIYTFWNNVRFGIYTRS